VPFRARSDNRVRGHLFELASVRGSRQGASQRPSTSPSPSQKAYPNDNGEDLPKKSNALA